MLFFLPLIGIFLEQFIDNGPRFHITDKDSGEFQDINNWSHCSMYAYFMLYGAATIANSLAPTQLNTELRNLMMAVSLFIEGFLFFYHLHARDTLEVRIHMMLVYAIWLGACFALALVFVDKGHFSGGGRDGRKAATMNGSATRDGEASEYMPLTDESTALNNSSSSSTCLMIEESKGETTTDANVMELLRKISNDVQHLPDAPSPSSSPNHSLVFLLRMALTTTLVLQGTWFCQVATILYPRHGEPWKGDEHSNVMFSVICFTWHLVLVIGLHFLFACIVRRLISRR